MNYLILVILFNTWIFILFKLFPKYNIDSLQAITVNYWACVLTGIVVSGINPFNAGVLEQGWLVLALMLGLLLIVLFNLLSHSTAKEGVATTTITNKLSLVIPVFFSWILYDDQIGILKISGILLAIPAVVLSASKKNNSIHIKTLWLPIIIFIGSGSMDTFIKYAQHFYLYTDKDQSGFTIVGFGTAALIGSMVVLYRVTKGKKLFFKNIVAGIALGVPNYFSIYYLIKLFHSDFMQSSAIIPVNNIGIILVTTIVAIVFFREKATFYKVMGLALSIISIILIAISDLNG